MLNKLHVSRFFFFSNSSLKISDLKSNCFFPRWYQYPCDPFYETRSIIDRDHNTVRLEESIQALKFRRNEFSPNSRRGGVFLLKSCANIFSHWKPRVLDQVSHWWHWRIPLTVLSVPELWIKIPLNYPCWAEEMLIRLKMAKVALNWSSGLVLPSKHGYDHKLLR